MPNRMDTWIGAGAPATPPAIDVWQIKQCADRLHNLSDSIKSNPDQSPARIAGELEGLGMRLKHLVKHALVLALLISVLGWPIATGNAQMQQQSHPACDNGKEIAKQLDEKYGESVVAVGLQADGKLLQLYAAEGGYTWTAIVLSPNGMACIVMAGKHMEFARTPGHPA